eukprot:CAMPEP_0118674498 /NCGR_PEP_ID=MMETSP0800-20121206/919_1 /TAXON_ID=210618 ORGANISM="Striatella unipunctata, Strain CCMP2910" /NCGR_SAMPLE_ID=MMETSP0800 /ASSEMBLY_ACC=CAM_ASM_000638 /LENGTH=184 /DNA_ID=CAMNT_0006569695 /DNA_START=33 /DNA_END=587 /DNA_ORIENTATION=-
MECTITSDPGEFVCPISIEVMNDPVLLHESGHSYDKEFLCKSLRARPNLDPLTNKRYDEPVFYTDNLALRGLMVKHFGSNVYKPYDDSIFLLECRNNLTAIPTKEITRRSARQSNTRTAPRTAPRMTTTGSVNPLSSVVRGMQPPPHTRPDSIWDSLFYIFLVTFVVSVLLLVFVLAEKSPDTQ